ncbi:MAG TPA: pre-peptidase C-terminal domain-containing protein [Thermoanaerobaculia bacterium]|nr:pre-peptidase C-terminal domain-containing protein [Thermoanaerobaculia bacterium]
MKSPAKSFLPGVLGALLSLLIGPAAASADQNLQIDEVMAGAFGRPELQFVELRLGSCEPRQWAGTARLAFFDATDNEVGEFVFPADPSVDGCFEPGRAVLIATQALADLPAAPIPDFVMPPLLVPGSGKVCFQGLPGGEPANLCLSYGAFTGDSEQGSPGNAPPLVPTRICSVRRQALFGDFGEPNFNEDFGLGEPLPRGREILVPSRFRDVSLLHPFGRFAEALFNAGVTGGCGNGFFCPQAAVTRDQMAVFLLRSKEGSSFTPPACTAQMFADVPCSHPFAPWINELAARGITGGCGNGNYCPGGAVTREQMAVFLLLTLEGPGFAAPACAVPVFGDVPCVSPFAPWIHELAQRGITGGCGGGNFCPGGIVTREQMAVFLSTAFALPVPSFDCSDGPIPRDDHGDEPANATPIAVGVPTTGTLETTSDQDVFSFPVQAGKVYHVDVALLSDGSPLPLVFLNINGETLVFTPAFLAPVTGTVFVRVFPDQTRTGRYQLTVRGPIPDDHGDSAGAATRVTPVAAPPGSGPGTPGILEHGLDSDFFAFDVQAGRLYAVEAAGSPDLRLTILGPDGPFAMGDSSRFFGDLDTVALFTAPVTGTVFASVEENNPFPAAAYTLRVRGPLSDAAGAVPLTSGVPAFGELPEGDADLFSFQAGAGQVFLIDAGALTNSGFVIEVLGTNGSTVLLSGNTFVPPLVLTAPTTGTYFVRLHSSTSPAVYRVVVRGPLVDDHGDDFATATPLAVNGSAVAGNIEIPNDVDVFRFTVAQAGLYRIQATDLSTNLRLFPSLRLPDGGFPSSSVLQPGTYFVIARADIFSAFTGTYRLAVTGPLADDHGNTIATATLLPPGSPAVAGRFEVFGDVDVFAFDAMAGQSFRLKVGRDQPPVFGDFIVSILAPDGVTPLSFFTETFTVPSTGRYFLRLSGPETGYRLTLGPAFADDHGDTPEDATLLTVGAPATNGFHHLGFDVDVFAFDAAAGETLIIETGGLGPSSDTVIQLVGTDGFEVLAADDDSAGALASRITFTFASSGRYFVRVFQQTNSIGIYQIAVRSAP